MVDLFDTGIADTERLLSRAWMLLHRYGVVSREMVAAEELSGGFGVLYPVLKELESGGRIRRGYFVEGLSGAQFALPGAVERLRALRADVDGAVPKGRGLRVLGATDPANPYGALLPWPPGRGEAGAPKRTAGAQLVLVGGRPLLYLAASGHRLLTFPQEGDTEPADLATGLQLLAQAHGRSLCIERIDGEPAADSGLQPTFQAAGFVADYRGLVLEKRFA